MKSPALACLLALLKLNCAVAEDAPLTLVNSIPLPGVRGKFDHLAVDAATQRVFIAAKVNNMLEVVDLKGGVRLQSLAGFAEPQGVTFLKDSNQVVVANGGSGEVQVLDAASLKVTTRFVIGDDADNVRFDASAQRVYVACKTGIHVIDSQTMKQVAEVPMIGHPEAFKLEPGSQRIFVCVPKVNSVFVLDGAAATVTGEWKLTSGKSNYPCDLDVANHRLFVGCRKPSMIVVIDTTTGKEVTSLSITGDTDDLIFDAAHKRIYSIGGAGAIDAIGQVDADHYKTLASVPTAPLARTGTYVAEWDQVLVPVPEQGEHAAELRVYQAKH